MRKQDIDKIVTRAKQAINKATDLLNLDKIRVGYLGKKGELTDLLKALSNISKEDRPAVGQALNFAKQKIQLLLDGHSQKLKEAQLNQALQDETIDVTLPGRGQKIGSLHPVMQVNDRVIDIFTSMGFVVATGPEIEDEYHNFEALNIPSHHPARDMHDTFYFEDNSLLRTHMSPVQIRYMEQNPPPIRIIAPGRVYRCDFDVTHTPMFHQMEGLLIDKDVNFAGLKSLIGDFLHAFFEEDMPIRFRPSYFPFTEPSAEVDTECMNCQGKGCHICKGSGWIEILGCGMVHPNVLKFGHIDSNEYSGFAFGLGIDRLAMRYFGIKDLRTLFENDIRFLSQF